MREIEPNRCAILQSPGRNALPKQDRNRYALCGWLALQLSMNAKGNLITNLPHEISLIQDAHGIRLPRIIDQINRSRSLAINPMINIDVKLLSSGIGDLDTSRTAIIENGHRECLVGVGHRLGYRRDYSNGPLNEWTSVANAAEAKSHDPNGQ
jgi:hypothetical protein